ncbi:MAG: M67 family metallopeptidase [Nitrospirae bacterium]|nr:M67 family metallopeptidase [Candidatus Manganitrophaceae bacterium]
MVQMSSDISERMMAHAQKEDPYECCGLLAGKDGIATEIYEITNLPSDDPSIVDLKVPADRTLRYVMDPKEQITAFKLMRENGTELVAIYHSHTHSPAYPSETDIRLAFYPDVHYLIVSLEDKNKPHIRAFRIIERKITEDKIVLTDTSNK